MEYYLDGAIDEIEEVRESLRSQDHDELELEVGDLLWDVLSLIHKLGHAGLIDVDQVCVRSVAKFAERMPYNVLSYREDDPDVRESLWESAKKRQKTH